MKKLLLLLPLLVFSLQACSVPGLYDLKSTTAPTSIPTSTPVLSPTMIPSSTPTLIPTPTPTPVPEVRVAEADHALFNGDYQAALDAYSTAADTSTDPGIRAAALLGMGRIHYLTGDYPSALNELRAIIDTYPNSTRVADAYYFLGETFMQLDRYTEAADSFSNFLTISPGVLDAFINERRGDALIATEDNRAALTAYTNAVQSPRLITNFLLELKLAQTYVLVGDYTTAQVVYEDIYTRSELSCHQGSGGLCPWPDVHEQWPN